MKCSMKNRVMSLVLAILMIFSSFTAWAGTIDEQISNYEVKDITESTEESSNQIYNNKSDDSRTDLKGNVKLLYDAIHKLPNASELTLQNVIDIEKIEWMYNTLNDSDKVIISAEIETMKLLNSCKAKVNELLSQEELTEITEYTTLNWSQFLGNERLQGISDGKSVTSSAVLAKKWEFNISKGKSDWAATPGAPITIGDYTYVYLGGELRKIRNSDGVQVDSAEIPGSSIFFINLTYGDGKIFVPRFEKNKTYVIAYDAKTLEQLYVTAKITSGSQAEGYTVYKDGYVYLSSWGLTGQFVCFDTSDDDKAVNNEEKQFAWIYESGSEGWMAANVAPAFVGNACIFPIGTARRGPTKIVSANAKTGDVIGEYTLPNSEVVSSSVVYNEKNNRVYISSTNSTSGAVIRSLVVNNDGTLNESNALEFISSVSGGGTQSTPVIYNDRLYLGGGGGTMGSAEPFHVIDANTLKGIYTIDELLTKGTVGLTTAYATKENNYEVYIYMVPYAPITEKGIPIKSQLYIIKDSVGQTKPNYEVVDGIGLPEYCSQSVIVDKDGNLIFYNDAKGVYCYGTTDSTAITAEDIERQIDILPEVDEYLYYNKVEVERIKERYDILLSSTRKANIDSNKLEKLNNIIEIINYSDSQLLNYILNGIENLPGSLQLDDVGIINNLVFLTSKLSNITIPDENKEAFEKLNKNKVKLDKIISGEKAPEPKLPKNVTVRIESDNGTILSKQNIEIKEFKTLEEYGVTGTPEEKGYVSVLHIICEALKQNNIDINIKVTGGWLNEFQGFGANLMYYVDGKDNPIVFTSYEVKDGDHIVVIQCNCNSGTYTGYGYFDKESAEVKVGEELKLKYSYVRYGLEEDVVKNGPLYVSEEGSDKVTIATGKYTDENGIGTFVFDKPGTYVVSARHANESGRLASNPYCKVTVTKGEDPKPSEPDKIKLPKNVTVRIETDNGTILSKQEVEIDKYTTLKQYGVTGDPIEEGYISVLHMICESLQQNGIRINMNIKSTGWLNELQGLGENIMYYVDGEDNHIPFPQFEIKGGEDIVVIQCTKKSGYYTAYGYFDKERVGVEVGDKLELEYAYEGWSVENGEKGVAKNAPLYVSKKGSDKATIATGEYTDKNGIATFVFDKPGTYVVSARYSNDSGRVASNPYCKVVVKEKTGSSNNETIENPVDSNIEESSKIQIFKDVIVDSWYYDAASFMYEKGITKGVTEDKFGPSLNATKAQVITMICRAFSIEQRTGDNFDDAGNTWYTGYLAAAKQLGISIGEGNNKVNPNANIIRQEIVTLIYNYLLKTNKIVDNIELVELKYNDLDEVSSWSADAIRYAVSNNWIEGKDGNLLAPKDNVTRAEISQIIFNIFKQE